MRAVHNVAGVRLQRRPLALRQILRHARRSGGYGEAGNASWKGKKQKVK